MGIYGDVGVEEVKPGCMAAAGGRVEKPRPLLWVQGVKQERVTREERCGVTTRANIRVMGHGGWWGLGGDVEGEDARWPSAEKLKPRTRHD